MGTEGLDPYHVHPVWWNHELDSFANIDSGAEIRQQDGSVFYEISGEALEKLLRLAGFEPIGGGI